MPLWSSDSQHVICLFGTIMGYFYEAAQLQSIYQTVKFMMRHTVVFKLKYSLDFREEQDFLMLRINWKSFKCSKIWRFKTNK